METLLLTALIPCAVLLDALLGEPPEAVHPVCALGRWARLMERCWRSLLGGTFAAGMLAALSATAPFLLAAWYCTAWAARSATPFLSFATAAFTVYLCLAPRSLARHACHVLFSLQHGGPAAAREAVSRIVGRDSANLDAHGILRAAIESVSENLTDGVLATIFWATAGALIAGFEGAAAAAVLHRCLNTLDALWGKRNDRYRRFGTFAARTDDVLNWLPARFSLPVISFSCLFIPGCSARDALITGWRYRRAHASPNSPWSEAAFAGALGLKLGGPVSYKGVSAPYPCMGDGSPNAEPKHLEQAIRLMLAACATAAVTAAVIIIIIG